jgi:hypothetical protein
MTRLFSLSPVAGILIIVGLPSEDAAQVFFRFCAAGVRSLLDPI